MTRREAVAAAAEEEDEVRRCLVKFLLHQHHHFALSLQSTTLLPRCCQVKAAQAYTMKIQYCYFHYCYYSCCTIINLVDYYKRSY